MKSSAELRSCVWLSGAIFFSISAIAYGQQIPRPDAVFQRPVWKSGDQAEYQVITSELGPRFSVNFKYRKMYYLQWQGRVVDATPLARNLNIYLARVTFLPPDENDKVFVLPGLGHVNLQLPPNRLLREKHMYEVYGSNLALLAQASLDRSTGPLEDLKVASVRWQVGGNRLEWPLRQTAVQTIEQPMGREEWYVVPEKVGVEAASQELETLAFHWRWTGNDGRRVEYSTWFARAFPVPVKTELVSRSIRERYSLLRFSAGQESLLAPEPLVQTQIFLPGLGEAVVKVGVTTVRPERPSREHSPVVRRDESIYTFYEAQVTPLPNDIQLSHKIRVLREGNEEVYSFASRPGLIRAGSRTFWGWHGLPAGKFAVGHYEVELWLGETLVLKIPLRIVDQ